MYYEVWIQPSTGVQACFLSEWHYLEAVIPIKAVGEESACNVRVALPIVQEQKHALHK